MGNDKAYNRFGHQHMVKPLSYTGAQGKVKEDVHQNKGAPSKKLAKPII